MTENPFSQTLFNIGQEVAIAGSKEKSLVTEAIVTKMMGTSGDAVYVVKYKLLNGKYYPELALRTIPQED